MKINTIQMASTKMVTIDKDMIDTDMIMIILTEKVSTKKAFIKIMVTGATGFVRKELINRLN